MSYLIDLFPQDARGFHQSSASHKASRQYPCSVQRSRWSLYVARLAVTVVMMVVDDDHLTT